MSNAKVDRIKLTDYLNEGKSQADCARIFNVSEAAISNGYSLDKLMIGTEGHLTQFLLLLLLIIPFCLSCFHSHAELASVW